MLNLSVFRFPMNWRKPTPEEMMRLGFMALFVVGIVATAVILLLNLR